MKPVVCNLVGGKCETHHVALEKTTKVVEVKTREVSSGGEPIFKRRKISSLICPAKSRTKEQIADQGEIKQGFPGTFLEKSGIATDECSKPGQTSLHVVGTGSGRQPISMAKLRS